MAPLTISVIVPVLDEERQIEDCLAALRAQAVPLEVIVVDGGSADRTRARARAADQVLVARRGRGPQLRAGAAAAHGEVLLFLHADARLPVDAGHWIADTARVPRWSGGAFRVRHEAEGMNALARQLLRTADWRSRWTRVPYGDQAVFTTRVNYLRCGGFPDQPLMEDIEFARRLRRLGPIRRLPAVVRVSGRRFRRRPLRAALCWNTFPTLYRLGVSAERLASWYGRG